MSERFESDPRDPRSPDDLGELLRLAGPRTDDLSQADLALHRDAARMVWLRQQRHRRLRRVSQVAVLAAAVLLLALGLRVVLDRGAPLPAVRVAEVVTLSGVLESFGGDGWQPLAEGMDVQAGERVRAASAAALQLEGGVEVRLAAATETVWHSAERVELLAGRAYVDTRSEGDREQELVEITTALGTVRDVGTRFEVAVVPEALTVRVRSGRVRLEHGAEVELARAGEALEVSPDGAVVRREISAVDPAWSWILEVPRDFALDGVTLRSYLEWIEAETGLEASFEDAALEQESESLVLHGDIDSRQPMESLALVAEITALDLTPSAARLLVSR